MVDENYQDIEPGQEGELLIRAPVVMEAYFKNEKATKEAFYDFGDGSAPWFCSGDIGVMRDGKFYIVDRKKELLKYKGLQVAPAELENLLFTHPAVAEAAVVGVPAPDDPTTDLPRAYVVLSSKMGATEKKASAGTWPATPALEGEAAAQRAASNDTSKSDTLSQTKYFDSKDQAQSQTADSSKQDTLSQTRYTDQKEATMQTSLPKSTGSDSSKQDTLSQTRYSDTKETKASDSSKQDTLSQTRYMDSSKTATQSEDDLAEELKKYVAERVAQHKQLRGGIKFVDELPRNAIGKFLRRDLRIRAKKEIEIERGVTKSKL